MSVLVLVYFHIVHHVCLYNNMKYFPTVAWPFSGISTCQVDLAQSTMSHVLKKVKT